VVVGNGKFSLTAMTMMVGGATTTLTLLRGGGGCTRSKKGMHPHQLPIQKAEETQRLTGYMGIILKCKRHWSTADLQKDKQKPAVGIVRRERESDR